MPLARRSYVKTDHPCDKTILPCNLGFDPILHDRRRFLPSTLGVSRWCYVEADGFDGASGCGLVNREGCKVRWAIDWPAVFRATFATSSWWSCFLQMLSNVLGRSWCYWRLVENGPHARNMGPFHSPWVYDRRFNQRANDAKVPRGALCLLLLCGILGKNPASLVIERKETRACRVGS